jgi:hypothetical protein
MRRRQSIWQKATEKRDRSIAPHLVAVINAKAETDATAAVVRSRQHA